MSATDTPNKAMKESLTKSKEPGGYLSALAGGKSPISMPPIPSWMLNTPMYSKLPMIPAPKGKITLYTTGLGEKLYPTPSELDFDPNAEGLISEYKSLHDPHLRSHYTQPATFHDLIKKKFITPDGKVICTLKEFNEYHQYLKRVHIEKIAQDRKTVAMDERKDRERQRQEWTNKEELSPHDKHIIDIQARKRKMLKEQHRRVSHQLEEDAVRHMRLVEARQTKRSIEKARSNLEREKKRNKKLRFDLEEHIQRVAKRMTLAQNESRHADMLKCYRMNENDTRQLKLDDQWNRHQRIREKHSLEGARKRKELQVCIEDNIHARQKSVSTRWSQQHSTFEYIRDTRAMTIQMQEAKIQARLEKKLKAVHKRFEQRHRKPPGGRRGKPPRHGLGGPRHYSTWPVQHALDNMELSPADGVWKIDYERYPPICSPVSSTVPSPTVFIEPKDILPSISRRSDDKFEKIQEEEEEEEAPATDIPEDDGISLSSLELTILFGDHHDSFITTARELVGNVLQALETERRSIEDISKEPEAVVESEACTPQETRLPEIMRRSSIFQLTNSTVARLVLSRVFCRAKEQIIAEGGLPQLSTTTPTRMIASDTAAAVVIKQPSITKQTSMGEMPSHMITLQDDPSAQRTSSSLLAAAVVSDALRNVTQELEQEAQRSDTSVLAEDLVWNTIRNVTDQLQKELTANISLELVQESQRSDTSILAEDIVQDAIRNVTSQLQKELTDSGTSLIAERVVTDAIRNAAQQLREMPLRHSSTSIMAEELASNAIRNATRQLQVLLPQSSSSIIAEAIAADAMKNVMRQLGEQPPQTSSSILSQLFAADALKNVKRQLDNEQILYALHPPAHSSSSLLAQAIANNTIKKVTKQLQREREALHPHSSSSLLAQAVTNDALANAVRQLETKAPLLHSDSSLLAQVVTKEALQNAALHLQIEKHMPAPQTGSSILAQDITIDAVHNAVLQLTKYNPKPTQRSSSRLAQVTVDDALQTAKEQLKTERASSRCRSRGSRSASPFSPELAKSAINQTSPEPTQGSKAKTRAVASDIIKRENPCLESPLPTKDVKTPPLSPGHPTAVSGLQQEIKDSLEKVFDGLSCQAQVVVMQVVEGALASINQNDEVDEESQDERNVIKHRSGILLATVNDVFQDSETDVSHQHKTCASGESEGSDSEAESDGDEIIGVVENEIIAEEESVHSLAECLEGSRVEGLTSVVKKSHDKTIFEGAVITHDKTHESVTEKVLSVEDLHKDNSGHLVHDASSKSIHKVSESGEYSKEGNHDARHQYNTIVPIYQSHLLNLEEEIIAHNLSAISMKPDNQHKVPSAYSASCRNSFRNIFRPDMTHCQGSAKCLKDTLVKELSHPHDEKHTHVYGVLDEPHEDIAAHHSDEELVEQQEIGGVCYLPIRKIYKVHDVLDDVVPEEQDPDDGIRDEDSEIVPDTPQDSKDTPAGGDFQSPHEEEVAATLPVSRLSSKSLRSGKSREIQIFHSMTMSHEENTPSSSPRGSPKLVSSTTTKSTTETKTSTQAASSRSVIGAVIDRISSIFSRKHSIKIHPGSTDKAVSESTRKHKELSGKTGSDEDDSRSKVDGSTKASDNISSKDDHAAKTILVDMEEVAVGAAYSRDASPTCSVTEALEDEGIQNKDKDISGNSQDGNKIETPDINTASKQDMSTSDPSDERNEDKSSQCSNKQGERELSAASLTEENKQNVESQEAEIKLEKKDKPTAENEVINDSEGDKQEREHPLLEDDKLQMSGIKCKDLDMPEKSIPENIDLEKKQEANKKVFRSDSDSVVGRACKAGTPKACASLSTTISRQKTSTGASSGRLHQKSSKSPSPKPRGRTSSPYSSKTQLRQVKVSTHTGQQQTSGNGKPNSVPTGTSMPTLPKQRSQVSKPPSSGSVRLIKVSPAPSMSSARRRSSSVGKLMSGKVSGGSVRLINVSPAASTSIGPRRSSRNSDKMRLSTSVNKSKGSLSSSSMQASNTAHKIPTRQASSDSLHRESQPKANRPTIESQPGQMSDESGQPSSLHPETMPYSGSFVIIQSPTEIPPAEEKAQIVSTESPGFLDSLSNPQGSGQQDHQSTERDLAPVRLPDPHGADEDTEKDHGDEWLQVVTKEPAASPGKDNAEDLPLQQSDVNYPQLQKVSSTNDATAQLEDPTPPSDDKSQPELAQSSSNSTHSQGATRGRRSRSLISAVIERLSRMFSGEVRGSKSTIDVRHQSDTKTGARSQGTPPRAELGISQPSQSTGALRAPQTASDGQESQPELQTRSIQPKSTKRRAEGVRSSGASSKFNISEASLPVPPNSASSDSSATPNVPAAAMALITTTHSTGSSQSACSSKQDPGSNNLPPVEDVETSKQTLPPQGKLTTSKDILDK